LPSTRRISVSIRATWRRSRASPPSPIVGAGFFQLLREVLARIFGDQFPYLIPLGLVFIVMIIFLP
jgi:ABC-type branched-subunit amino acid transport system permease subunit